jgi:hypothetical protein
MLNRRGEGDKLLELIAKPPWTGQKRRQGMYYKLHIMEHKHT